MMSEHEIVQTFEITGRGAVVVIPDITAQRVGKSIKVEILTPNGATLCAEAFKEWLLRHQPEAVENEAYHLIGLHKKDIPEGSRLRFLD
ncbi:hypothetical protein HPT27_11350 [Permianibacter sp. IMCC34836]|uniref:hypothetical protein n=1 Tax=Permianibacter fluminis TaxID=2738515 RepID=UPI00155688BA|nr:hypothetical protein [Permianibacter fluminis]NQD37622.1 hypothetical protein [Permianibacter fluminis]